LDQAPLFSPGSVVMYWPPEHQADAHQICTSVSNLAGKTIKLTLPRQATVACLRSHIEEAWQIPALCQRLVIGTQVLRDPERLTGYCHLNEDALLVLMIVSLCGAVQAALDVDTKLDERLRALEAIMQMGRKAGEQERLAVEQLLRDTHNSIRVAAVNAMGGIVSDGDAHGIAMLSSCLEDPCSRVRSAAASILVRGVWPKHVESVFEAVSARLSHPEAFVRRSAVYTLSRFKGKLDPRVVGAHVNLTLENREPAIRSTALEALSQLAEKGNEDALAIAIARLDDPEGCVRCAALAAIGCIAMRGDRNVVATLLAALTDTCDCVRQAALSELPRLVPKDDAHAITAVSMYLEHSNAEVQLLVPHALMKVAVRGNVCALENVGSRLAHPDSRVRAAAVHTLGCIAKGSGDECAVSVVTGYLVHPQGGTRAAAIQTLSSFSEECVDVGEVAKSLTDPEKVVRDAAVDAIARVAAPDDPSAIASIRPHLRNACATVRLSAVHALAGMSSRGNATAILILCRCLKDAELEVRRAAVAALGRIAPKGNGTALSALRTCRQEDRRRAGGITEAVYEAEARIRSLGPMPRSRASETAERR